MFTKQAVGSFLAGGVLVGGVAFAGVAHGAGTGATAALTRAGQSDAQYTAKHAWAQTVSTVAGTTTTLTIPSGDRLTVTFANGGVQMQCTIKATLNGATVGYGVGPTSDGTYQEEGSVFALPFQPIYMELERSAAMGHRDNRRRSSAT